jgi:hypothetical protein
VWRDFVTDDGGGVLDLVMRVLGCSRADALRWCADLAGVTLDETPSSPEDRARWARERRGFECELSDARYWRRTVIVLLEELLDSLKAAFFGPSEGERPSGFELRDVTQQLERLRRLDGAALVGEYADWKRDFPRLTAGMVWAASTLYAAERRAVEHYLAATDVHTA